MKETLRKSFARAAEDLMVKLQKVEHSIGALRGSLQVCADRGMSLRLQDQKRTLVALSDSIPSLRSFLQADIAAVNTACLEANVEENDYTVLTYDDLEYELELAEAELRKKIAFVDNQVGRPR